MKMTYETKAGYVGGSTTTVIPAAVVNLLKIVKGDKIIWDVDISEKGATVTVIPKKSNKETK